MSAASNSIEKASTEIRDFRTEKWKRRLFSNETIGDPNQIVTTSNSKYWKQQYFYASIKIEWTGRILTKGKHIGINNMPIFFNFF